MSVRKEKNDSRKPRKPRRLLLVIAVNLLVLAVLFSLVELVYRGLRLRHAVIASADYYQYDSRLGWVPKPGQYRDPEGRKVTITERGFRLTAPPAVEAAGPVILAVGCSYTFCEEVSDEETWPYYLSRELGFPVVNAGVASYGFDQMVMRLEDELDRVNPDIVLVAFIYQDMVFRSRLSFRRQHKPYFDVVGGRLELFNQPVPPPWENPIDHPWYERSLLVRDLLHLISDRPGFVNEVVAHDNALEVCRKLIANLDEELRKRGIPWTMVLMPTRPVPTSEDQKHLEEITAMVRGLDAPMVDLWEEMYRDFPQPTRREFLWNGHMSSEGNRWVAGRLARILQEDSTFWKRTDRGN